MLNDVHTTVMTDWFRPVACRLQRYTLIGVYLAANVAILFIIAKVTCKLWGPVETAMVLL